MIKHKFHTVRSDGPDPTMVQASHWNDTHDMDSPLTTLSYSATPVFDAAVSGGLPFTFKITLTGNVTSSTVVNAVNGQELVFIIIQDATGNRAFNWPASFKGAIQFAGDVQAANAIVVQKFVYDGTSFYAISPGAVI